MTSESQSPEGPDLAAGMSRYLVDRITGLANVEVLTQTNVTGLEGRDGVLEAIRWRQGASGREVRRAMQHGRLIGVAHELGDRAERSDAPSCLRILRMRGDHLHTIVRRHCRPARFALASSAGRIVAQSARNA